MANTYTLTPTQLYVAPQAEGQTTVVVRVAWEYSATDGTYVATMKCPVPTVVTYTAGSPFTPYDQLTKEQVASWVLASWSFQELVANQRMLDDNIAAQKASAVVAPPVPWA